MPLLFTVRLYICIYCDFYMPRLQLMVQQEACVQQEVTAPWLLLLLFPVPLEPLTTSLASGNLRSASAVHQGNNTHSPTVCPINIIFLKPTHFGLCAVKPKPCMFLSVSIVWVTTTPHLQVLVFLVSTVLVAQLHPFRMKQMWVILPWRGHSGHNRALLVLFSR